MSAFSPYTDSPTSPQPFRSPNSQRNSDGSQYLHPPSQASPVASSPSDVPDPSPIAPSSNGTDTTDIDDTGIEGEDADVTPSLKPVEPELKVVDTPARIESLANVIDQLETERAGNDPRQPRSDEDEQPNSVIHAPQGFESFQTRQSPPSIRRSTPTPSQISDITIISPGLPEEHQTEKGQDIPSSGSVRSPISPPPITTSIPPVRDWSATPRAQTRPEVEIETEHQRSSSQQRSSNLEDIPEAQDVEQADVQTPGHHGTLFDETVERFQETADEVAALKVALSECWTLCNTLAGLSYVHRERIFNFAGKGDVQQQAWKSCWKLCQKLYETRDEDFESQVRPTLDLCREFCQSLFDVRQRENEVADSVLRVSFELNNHLYNTHDRTLPEAFRERTLDFYITLCHRLMKQRTRLAEETDSLLRACWSLAEMLFSLRQNKRDGKPADEELLGSAVQACWELCDLFREGWTQVRPDRGTPRPSQTTFTQAFQQAKQTAMTTTPKQPLSYDSEDDDMAFGRLNPETPTTVFEDTQQVSPDDAPVPNILVLGPDQTTRSTSTSTHQHSQSHYRNQGRPQQSQWNNGPSTSTNNPSSLSGYTHSPPSERTTSSNSTIINPSNTVATEDPHLTCLKLLIVKAALISGYQRPSSTSAIASSPRTHPHSHPQKTPPSSSPSLSSFVKALPSNSFGTAPWQVYLLEQYKKLVASDPGFRHAGPLRRASARDVARSVRWMVSTGQYVWLKDLFRWVVGWYVEEGEEGERGGVLVQG